MNDRPGTPYVAILQLTRTDVPELGFPPGVDLFQLSWCPNDHEPNFGPTCLVFWRRVADIRPLAVAPAPSVANQDYLPAPCTLHPERIVEYPAPHELSDDLTAAIWAWQRQAGAETVYQYELSVAQGTKIGGYVHWIQDPEVPHCPAGHPMEHLLTIASAEFDGGTWRCWLAVEEAAVWGAPYWERDLIQRPAGLMLGDMGSLYMFVCRACEDLPIATVSQCS